MAFTISKAAVIGSGVMGGAIAAHLANAGIPTLLLDVKREYAEQAVARLRKTNPTPLFRDADARLITPGELEADADRLAEADWIIEAVTERLDVKRKVLETIESARKCGAIVSTNTSGISVNEMVEGRGAEFAEHFLGTHFFNPPRYMKLLELIPAEATSPEVVRFMQRFCAQRLGKGVVLAKDTPNFIANRIGTYGLLVTLQEMERGGYSVEEVDAVTGPAMGRPKSATFRTLDLVGLDTFAHVAANVHDSVNDTAERAAFEVPPPLRELVARGWLGEKSGQGFYKKFKGPHGSVIQALNLSTFEYADSRRVTAASLEAAKQAKGARGRLKALLSAGDRYSRLAWNLLAPVLLYAADKLGDIADTVADVDNAMRWGFNWDLGPFEIWDAIGVRASVERMQSEGRVVPEWVETWLAAGGETFYKTDGGKRFYVSGAAGYEEEPRAKEEISLRALKAIPANVIRSNAGASLIDLGGDVACLEFHSPNNAIGADILTMINESVEEVRRNWRGLVVANEGRNFCVGANLMLLLMEAQDEEWDEVDRIIRMFQDAMMALKRLERPVVAAPHRMTLGGGVEACLPADRIVFAAETYFGLVETGVGLIPAGGGCKELALRISSSATLPDPDADLQPAVNAAFETVALAKVSTSGAHARDLGYAHASDTVIMNGDRRIYEAKRAVLAMDEAGYAPPQPEPIRVVGRDGAAVLKMGAYTMRRGGYISEHDLKIAYKLAHVLSGGDVPAGALVTEQHMLDLEREAFLSLTGEPLTQARMQHMLATGKPLRN